jgi:hypothetical protein
MATPLTLFDPDPFAAPPQIGGNEFTAQPKNFPAELAQPDTYTRATITPFPDIASIVFAPLEGIDAVATVFIGIALFLGPDFILAPAGLIFGMNEGIRPGFALELVIGEILMPNDQWVLDRKEKLEAQVPLQIRALALLPFLPAGLLVSRLLLVAIEDQTFVISVGIISCLGGSLLDLLRERKPTRAERDLRLKIEAEFLRFSGERLAVGGRCHEREIVEEFRKYYPRYRFEDMSGTRDGVSLGDDLITYALRDWNGRLDRPGERTPSGYWKGICVAPPEKVR